MSLPPLVQQLVEKRLGRYCRDRVPAHVRDQLRVEFKIWRNHVTLFEVRPVYRDPSQWTRGKVAQFRYDSVAGRWELYWPDRNGRWHPYDLIEATPDLDEILAEIDRDPTGIFWG